MRVMVFAILCVVGFAMSIGVCICEFLYLAEEDLDTLDEDQVPVLCILCSIAPVSMIVMAILCAYVSWQAIKEEEAMTEDDFKTKTCL